METQIEIETEFCKCVMLRCRRPKPVEVRVDTKRKRLTVDLDPLVQRRLKVIAALEGIGIMDKDLASEAV